MIHERIMSLFFAVEPSFWASYNAEYANLLAHLVTNTQKNVPLLMPTTVRIQTLEHLPTRGTNRNICTRTKSAQRAHTRESTFVSH